MVHYKSINIYVKSQGHVAPKNIPLVFWRKAILMFAAGFSMRHVHVTDADDCRFFMRGFSRLQPEPAMHLRVLALLVVLSYSLRSVKEIQLKKQFS